MDWNLILEYVFKIVGISLGTILTTYGSILFTKLKNKISEAKLNTFIDRCVRAAEQLFPNLGKKTGEEKYNFVLTAIKTKYPKLSEQYLKPLIEGAVYSVSEEVRQIANIKTETNTPTSILKIQ